MIFFYQVEDEAKTVTQTLTARGKAWTILYHNGHSSNYIFRRTSYKNLYRFSTSMDELVVP